MVVFTCNHCGESLQKPKVEKHYAFTCRREKFVTCVDCFKDFRGDDYNVHTKCITEEERYSGKDYVQKVKKGEVKQESWMEMIKSIIHHENNLSPNYKNLLDTVSYYNNVPRKKVKFINFIKSSTGGRTNIKDVEAIWDIIEKYKAQSKVSTDLAQNGNHKESEENKITIEGEKNEENEDMQQNNLKTKKSKRDKPIENGNKAFNESTNMKKQKISHTNDTEEEKNIENKYSINEVSTEPLNNEVSSFSFNEQILKLITKKQCISKQKLYKKIMKKYVKYAGESIAEEVLQKKINKKLKKIPNITVRDNDVKLIIQ